MMELPTSMWGAIGSAIFTAGGWGTLWLQTRRHGRTLGAVRTQVQNNHPTNLRDDLDGVKDAVEGIGRDVRGMREDIGSLRGEVRDEREARLALQRQVEGRTA